MWHTHNQKFTQQIFRLNTAQCGKSDKVKINFLIILAKQENRRTQGAYEIIK